MEKIKLNAIYRHYKGGHYKVIAIGLHSETQEELVIYQAMYGDNVIWCRPKYMWSEKVEYNGEIVKRFELIEDNNG